uniref:Uncharacterized protein n=1 Tax=Pararge aegeria TaxID=116150 RepID=S4Q002_9NEOP
MELAVECISTGISCDRLRLLCGRYVLLISETNIVFFEQVVDTLVRFKINSRNKLVPTYYRLTVPSFNTLVIRCW